MSALLTEGHEDAASFSAWRQPARLAALRITRDPTQVHGLPLSIGFSYESELI